MPDLAVSNDTEIIPKVQKTAEILMIFKVHTYGEQTVVSTRAIQVYKQQVDSLQLFSLSVSRCKSARLKVYHRCQPKVDRNVRKS